MVSGSITIVDSTLGDVVFDGEDSGNPLGVITQSRPPVVPRLTYPEASPFVDGNFPTHQAWDLTSLASVLEVTGATQADVETRYNRLRAAAGRDQFTVIQTLNGQSSTWSSHRAAITPSEVTFEELKYFRMIVNVTFPVQPQVGA